MQINLRRINQSQDNMKRSVSTKNNNATAEMDLTSVVSANHLSSVISNAAPSYTSRPQVPDSLNYEKLGLGASTFRFKIPKKHQLTQKKFEPIKEFNATSSNEFRISHRIQEKGHFKGYGVKAPTLISKISSQTRLKLSQSSLTKHRLIKPIPNLNVYDKQSTIKFEYSDGVDPLKSTLLNNDLSDNRKSLSPYKRIVKNQ